MSIFIYKAAELYRQLISEQKIAVLDVRNSKDFARSHVEMPYPFAMENISYFDFMEFEEESVQKVRDFAAKRPVYIICAKEGSAKYVAEILKQHGVQDVGYLEGGINSWGNLLVPVLLYSGKDYMLYQFIRPAKASCSYGLLDARELQLFDPSRNIEFYLDFAASHQVRITRSFETHLQADYIAGSRLLGAGHNVEIMANSADFDGAGFRYTAVIDNKKYGREDGPSVQVIFTPGHTPGSTCYLIDDKFLVSGDTVFLQSVGRPDLGGQMEAWAGSLFDSLQKVKKMPAQLQVLPGHYSSWDEARQLDDDLAFHAAVADVLAVNAAIYDIDNTTDFLQFIAENMRQQPEEYATIRKINLGIEEVDATQAQILDVGKNECAATAYSASQKQK